MLEHEKKRFEEFSEFRYNRYWMPFQWALSLCDDARRQQKIASDYLLRKVGEVCYQQILFVVLRFLLLNLNARQLD